MVVEKSLTQNFIILRMERRRLDDIGRINKRMLVPSPTIQQVIINLHPKYDHLACMVVEESLTKFIILRMERKTIEENWRNTGKKRGECCF